MLINQIKWNKLECMETVMEDPVTIPPPLEVTIEPLKTPQNTPINRNKLLLERYIAGVSVRQLANEFNISEVRVYQIVGKHKDIVKIDREYEKHRRLNRLKLLEDKASPKLAPKDATELVRVIEAQRKEIEGDSDGKSNQTVNITNIKIDQVNSMGQLNLWESTRKLLEG